MIKTILIIPQIISVEIKFFQNVKNPSASTTSLTI